MEWPIAVLSAPDLPRVDAGRAPPEGANNSRRPPVTARCGLATANSDGRPAGTGRMHGDAMMTGGVLCASNNKNV